MAQKETIEFVAKVDDQTNQVVPTSQTNTPVPKSPVVPVDPQAGLQETINASLSKEVAEGTLEELIQSSIAREAQLRVLREINQSIKNLEANPASPPPPGDPPTEIPTGFFDPEDNGEIPDLERLAQEQQDAIDDLIRSFDKIDNGSIDPQRFDETTAEFDKTFADMDAVDDNGEIPDLERLAQEQQDAIDDLLRSFDKVDDPKIDPQRFDETTSEFDKVFADMDAVDDTMNSLTESLSKPLEVLGLINPELTLFLKGLTGAVAGLSSLVVASQLYSSVLAATIENFGELSADVKEAQAKTEVARIQQQLRFADQFGEALADLEEGRNNQRESGREFLANLMVAAKPWLDAISAGFTALYDILNLIITTFSPVIEIFKFQMKILEQIYKTISFIANAMNPFKWFDSDKEGDNTSVWDSITAPENFLNVDNLRPTNVNGRDVYDMDDLMKKNL
jgi:hypothetical protein